MKTCKSYAGIVKTCKSYAGILLLLVVILSACAESGGSVPQGVNQGNQARDFTLEALDGTEVSLKDYKGRVVLVNFWATWCPPCKAEIPDILSVYEDRKDDGFVVLGVNVEESLEQVEPFVDELRMTYPVLLDESGRLFKMYRGLGLPMSLIIDREGVIQVRHVGFLTADQLERYVTDLLQ